MKKSLLLLPLALSAVAAHAQSFGHYLGQCASGATRAVTQGMQSTNTLQGITPSCKVAVYQTGTMTPATIYADGQKTPLANPFTANTQGSYSFYVFGAVDIVMSAAGMQTTTLSNVNLTPMDGSLLLVNPPADQTIQQPSGTTLSVNSLNAIYNAAKFAGVDILDKAQHALTACNLTYYPATTPPYVLTTACEIHIPPQVDYKPYRNVKTTLTLAGTANAQVKLVFDAGASIEYAGSDCAIRATYGPTVIESPVIYGTAAGSCGLWTGEFAKMAVYNYFLANFTNGAGLMVNGSDDPLFVNGSASNNKIGIGTSAGTQQGYPMNAGQFIGLHLFGNTVHQFDGTYLGAGNLIEGITCDPANPSAVEGCVVVGGGSNKTTIRNIYAEGQLTNGQYAVVIAGGAQAVIDGFMAPYGAPSSALIYDGGNNSVFRDIENGGVQTAIIDLSGGPFSIPDITNVMVGGEPLIGANPGNYVPYSHGIKGRGPNTFSALTIKGNMEANPYEQGIDIPWLVSASRILVQGQLTVGGYVSLDGRCPAGQQPSYRQGVAQAGTCQ